MFNPVKTKKVYEEIVAQIKQLIIDGKLQPGDKLLSERELSEKLNVSRASVREAFSALEMMGIIMIRPGEGSFVRQVSYEGMLEPLSFLLQVDIADITQVLEVRKILEAEMAALAAIRATAENLEELRRTLSSLIEEVDSGGIGDKADDAFHFAVARAANNPVLEKVMSTITDVMTNSFRASRQKLFLVKNMPQQVYESHSRVYAAIAACDSKLARSRMHEHLDMVEKTMLQLKQDTMNSGIKIKKQ
ncbi:FadR/GntR family transcriptional regulator [Acetonema longum]|uniref:GntR family transcriptional regulator n=1 Tax=Acetonema longum DSM 6540 TaxID=1009370 RepID=F7NHL7_9FIRM|nr:FadR/GntR family transcriptional regulator [Acetonema longum]EGO64392.1 GntR family transcriptional regulator [Acetonema longum DSM 6540]